MTSGEYEIFEEHKDLLGYSINPNIENFIVRNTPRHCQNNSEASSPQKLKHSYPMLQECHSRSSSGCPLSSCSSKCNINNLYSQEAQSFLAQAAEGKLILAYEGCRAFGEEVHRQSKNKKKRFFYDWVHPALLYNQNYLTKDAWSFISRGQELRDQIKLELDDQAATAFDLYYNYIKGRFYMYQRDFRESFEAFAKAAEILRKKQNGDPKETFYIKNNLAKLHYTSQERNYQEAERLLREGLQYSNENNDQEHKALCHFQLTELYIIQKDVKQAQENWRLSIEAANQITVEEQHLLFIARNLRNEGDLSFILGEKERGIHRYEIALGILNRILPQGNILNEKYYHELEVYRDEPGVSEMTLEFSDA
jgi:tetratricopeptide (TPR) repeat protein